MDKLRKLWFQGTLMLFLLLVSSHGILAQSLDTLLFNLPDVVFKAIPAPEGFEAAYELRIRQPIDHSHPEKGHFYQRAFLSHRGVDRPMVIATEGYMRAQNRMYEPTNLLKANQIDVEHRYFGESSPAELDYEYLNLEQVTADLHHIRELMGQIYPGKWVSTGISKGGQTTIFYRYFYPGDVSVSIPYVAPLNLQLEDPRVYAWLDTIGTSECRAAIRDFQIRMFKDKDEAMEKVKWYAKGKGLDFEYLTFEMAYEYSLLEYPFSFWQWGGNCERIPDKKATLDEAVEHLMAISNIDFFADQAMDGYASHYYQAATQMGYYGYESAPFRKYLHALNFDENPLATFPPNHMETHFDGSLMQKVYDWVEEKGNQFIYINGANDTWSATAVPPSDKVDALFFFLPGKHHGTARIRSMTDAEKRLMIEKLEEWLELEIED